MLAKDGAAGDAFGWDVAIDDGILAVSAPGDDDNGTDTGSVYLYDAVSRDLLLKLLPADGQAPTDFGGAIAIGNGLVAVGAVEDSDRGFFSGSVSVFGATTGELITELYADDGEAFDLFGTSVAIAEDVIAVGASGDSENGLNSGSVYLFDAASGAQLSKILPADGQTGAEFGCSVAIENDILVVGAWGNDSNNGTTGSAYLFDIDTGAQLSKLQANDASSFGSFGWSVAIDDGTVAVGALRQDGISLRTGAAYLFEANSGHQLAQLLPGDGNTWNAGFGNSVDIDSGYVVVGTDVVGAAYIFNVTTKIQVAKITPSARGVGRDYLFGSAVTIDDGVVVAGARFNDTNGTGAGSAYLYDVEDELCPADANHDGELTAGDFTYWLFARSAGDPECDQNGDGSCTPTDFTAWIANYNAGC